MSTLLTYRSRDLDQIYGTPPTDIDMIFESLPSLSEYDYVQKLIQIVQRFMDWMNYSKEADVAKGYCGYLTIGSEEMLFLGH
ncbi:hypothetical protein H0H81_006432, partial [Sphagnurus paluster]